MKAGFSTDAAPQPGEATVRVPFTPPPLDELKRLFPQLEVLELVGRGGMGAVYRARQPGLARWVALKILPPRSTQRAGFTERFTREARALARLNHASIVAVHDFGEAGGMPYFVMEFVEGVTLRRLVQQHRLGPREALQIVPQICDALQYAHDEGVVHRDIKPENILIDRKGRVKIADFGIAKILGDDQVRQTLTQDQVLGTPYYMAPEQIEHPAAVDHRADIYSLGVVFYEMLTGELPLGKFAPPSRKVEVDVRLDEVVLRALEKEPEHRYQHASEVKTAVETIAAATGVMSVPAEQPLSQAPQPSGPSGRYQFGLLASLEAGERVLHFHKRVGAILWKSLPTYRLNVSWPPLSEMELYVTDRRVIVVSHVLRLVTNEFSIWFPSAGPGAPRERFRQVTVGQSRWFGCYLDLISEHPEKTWYRSGELRLRLYLRQPELLERLILSAALGAQNASHGSREVVHKVQPTVVILPKWIRWTRWTARILSTLILLMVASFLVAEGLPPFITQPGGVQLTSLGGALVLLGLLVGWWREGTAAVLTAGGWTLIRVSENSFRITTPLEIVLVVALLFAIVWWASQGRRTFVAVAVAGILALALITGRLLLPTNVHLEGTVTDAISGKPLPRAELAVADALSSFPARRVFPNARVAGDGHFTLYVGWYCEQKPLQVSAPGYETLKTNLGLRPLGQRRFTRDYALVPSWSLAAPLGLESGAEDVAYIVAEEKLAGGDPKKRFLLLGPRVGDVSSTNGFPLLLVMPGGDGGPDFLPFVKRIYQLALPGGYMVAELIAPRWDEQQLQQIVWPTENRPYPGMKFSTEAFVHTVIREIEKQRRLDTRRLFTLSWSSGGPAGYAVSLYGGGRITGSLIGMSVFQPQRLPDLKAARGRAYFLLHSPEDDFVPIATANRARDSLTKHGAQATLVTYPGGHGWHGDVYGNIHTGIQWLERHATLPTGNTETE